MQEQVWIVGDEDAIIFSSGVGGAVSPEGFLEGISTLLLLGSVVGNVDGLSVILGSIVGKMFRNCGVGPTVGDSPLVVVGLIVVSPEEKDGRAEILGIILLNVLGAILGITLRFLGGRVGVGLGVAVFDSLGKLVENDVGIVVRNSGLLLLGDGVKVVGPGLKMTEGSSVGECLLLLFLLDLLFFPLE